MKQTSIFLFILFFFSISIHAQDQTKAATKQIGLTGVPIFYLNNGGGNSGGFNGIALYGNLGRVFKKYNVVGLRPFFGVSDEGFDKEQRLHSIGSNIYYRRYLNKNRWSFFLEANAGFGYLWYTSKFPDFNESLRENNGVMFNFAFGPGVDFEIKNGWNLELTVQYLELKNISHPENTLVGETIIPTIGFQKFF
jgi:hypothetical protein